MKQLFLLFAVACFLVVSVPASDVTPAFAKGKAGGKLSTDNCKSSDGLAATSAFAVVVAGGSWSQIKAAWSWGKKTAKKSAKKKCKKKTNKKPVGKKGTKK